MNQNNRKLNIKLFFNLNEYIINKTAKTNETSVKNLRENLRRIDFSNFILSKKGYPMLVYNLKKNIIIYINFKSITMMLVI